MHRTEVVSTFKANGMYVIEIACCGNHTFRHSMMLEALMKPEKLKESLAQGHKLAAQSHEAHLLADTILESLKGLTVEHE